VCRARFEERSKGATREITTNQQDRRTDLEVCKAWLFADLYFPQVGHYPKTGAQINNNKHLTILVFLFSGYFYLEIFVCNVFGFKFFFRYNVSLKTQLSFYSIN
jgi:hypothetical protein